MASSSSSASSAPSLLTSRHQLTDDGGWCWFESPRALLHPPWLLVGSIPSGHSSPSRSGSVELLCHHLPTRTTHPITLHPSFELDDHNSPAIYLRPDGRYLCTWARHGTEAMRYYRLSLPSDPLQWGDLLTFTPSPSTQLTYSNLLSLTSPPLLYDFFRGLHGSFKPSYATSSDHGTTWHPGHVLIHVPSTQKHRPYVRYASNHSDTIHLVYGEAHPRDYDTSIYHAMIRHHTLLSSDGRPLAALADGLASPDLGTLIYRGDSAHVAWPIDVALHEGRPTVVYSVQCHSQGLPVGEGGEDIRYRYARWVGGEGGEGGRWVDEHLAYAGRRLYADEDDYSGLVAIEPDEEGVVYASTSVHPATGREVREGGEVGKAHWELWKGVRRGKVREEGGGGEGEGSAWEWKALTRDSTDDNLRPIRPQATGPGGPRALVWLKGEYRAWVDYTQSVEYAEV